jgi:release factor glutamine methyltransferase
VLGDRDAALVRLGWALRDAGYAFVTVGPETHRRVEARTRAAGRTLAGSLRDVFGWSRPFEPRLLPPRILDLANAAGVLESEGALLRSSVRFSSLGGHLFVHSAYPTTQGDSVFFGPDTYRYCDLVAAEARPARCLVDVGCGSGAGGLVAASRADRVVLCDVNRKALRFAEVNATLAAQERRVEIVESDVLDGVDGSIDLVIANPPYMVDPARRSYRDGGGAFGEALGVRIARAAFGRLDPGGRLVLYTGAAIVDGVDTFLDAIRDLCEQSCASWHYREIDPDVFGEEIEQNDAYARVERIAAVALVATVAGPGIPTATLADR